MLLLPANAHDSPQTLPLVDAIPAVAGRVGRPRRRPDALFADRGFHNRHHRRSLARRSIHAFIAPKHTGHGSGLGRHRWVVERTFSWLHQFRRLRMRFDRTAAIHEAFLRLGCAVICFRVLGGTLC